jgi:asparagine synthase (glutamine-hydrolysing)
MRRYVIGNVLNIIPDGGWYKSKAHQAKWLHKLSFLDGSGRYARSLSYFYFTPERRASLYGSAMNDVLRSSDPEKSIRIPFDGAAAADDLDRMLYADSCVRLPDHPVMITDRMTMAHSLEVRSPFMDHELVEFAARLPIQMKVRGRKLRYIQYKLAERYLPKEVLKRPKQGFSSALPYMLRDEYKLLYRLFLKDSVLAQEGLYKQRTVDQLLMEHQSGKTDHGNRLWLLLNSEVWYRMFVKGESSDSLGNQIADSLGKGDDSGEEERCVA